MSEAATSLDADTASKASIVILDTDVTSTANSSPVLPTSHLPEKAEVKVTSTPVSWNLPQLDISLEQDKNPFIYMSEEDMSQIEAALSAEDAALIIDNTPLPLSTGVDSIKLDVFDNSAIGATLDQSAISTTLDVSTSDADLEFSQSTAEVDQDLNEETESTSDHAYARLPEEDTDTNDKNETSIAKRGRRSKKDFTPPARRSSRISDYEQREMAEKIRLENQQKEREAMAALRANQAGAEPEKKYPQRQRRQRKEFGDFVYTKVQKRGRKPAASPVAALKDTESEMSENGSERMKDVSESESQIEQSDSNAGEKDSSKLSDIDESVLEDSSVSESTAKPQKPSAKRTRRKPKVQAPVESNKSDESSDENIPLQKLAVDVKSEQDEDNSEEDLPLSKIKVEHGDDNKSKGKKKAQRKKKETKESEETIELKKGATKKTMGRKNQESSEEDNSDDTDKKKHKNKKGKRKQGKQSEDEFSNDEAEALDKKEKPGAKTRKKRGKKAVEEESEEESSEEDEDDESDSDDEWPADPNKLYCICRKPYNNRFMICCDKCKEWFHGACVGLTRRQGSQLTRNNQPYFCPDCRVKKKRKSPTNEVSESKTEESDSKAEESESRGEDVILSEVEEQKPFLLEEDKTEDELKIASEEKTDDKLKVEKSEEEIKADMARDKARRISAEIERAKERHRLSSGTGDEQKAEPSTKVKTETTKSSEGAKDKSRRLSGGHDSADRKKERELLREKLKSSHHHKSTDEEAGVSKEGSSEHTSKEHKKHKEHRKHEKKHHHREHERQEDEEKQKTIPKIPTKGRTFRECIVSGCHQEADYNSVYCGKRCIVKHAEDSLRLIAKEREKYGAKSSSTKSTERIIVLERNTGKVLTGPNAPTEQNLIAWLSHYPSFEVMRPGSSGKKKEDREKQKKDQERKEHYEKKEKLRRERERKERERKEKERRDRKIREKVEKNFPPAQLKQIPSSTSEATAPAHSGPDPIRLGVRKTLRDVLNARANDADDVMLSAGEIKHLAVRIEEELFKVFNNTGNRYKNRYRSLVFNIKDRKNMGLFRKILNGSIPVDNLVRMSSEQLASPELAHWREYETKHTLEMIELREREEQEAGEHIVKKTHKGEMEVADEDLSTLRNRSVKIDPRADILAGLLPSDTTSQHKSHLFDFNCQICTGKIPPPAVEEPTPKKVTFSKKVSLETVKPMIIDRPRSPILAKMQESISQVPQYVPEPVKPQYIPQPMKTLSVEKEKPIMHEAKVLPKMYQEIKSDDEVKIEVKKPDKIEVKASTSVPDLSTSKPEPNPAPKPKLKPSDVRNRYIHSDPRAQKQNIPEKAVSKPAALPTKSSSTTSIPSREVQLQAILEAKPKSLVTTAVWKGSVFMQDMAKFAAHAYAVSGNSTDLELADTIHVCGRISPTQVWDYLEKLKKTASSREVCLVKLVHATDDDKAAYIQFYTYLNNRKRCGVVANTSYVVKDMYIVPLPSTSPIPSVLLPFDGPGKHYISIL